MKYSAPSPDMAIRDWYESKINDLENRIEALTRTFEILLNVIQNGSRGGNIQTAQKIVDKLNYNPNNPYLK